MMQLKLSVARSTSLICLCALPLVLATGCAQKQAAAQAPATIQAALNSNAGYSPAQKATVASLTAQNIAIQNEMRARSANSAPADFKGNKIGRAHV